MKNFIEKYSAGKIAIKFHVLSPLVKNEARKIIFYSLIALTLLMFFIILPQASKDLGLPIVSVTIACTLLLMLGIDLYLKIKLFKVKRTGNVIFEKESLKQFDIKKNLILELPYSKIQKIEFKRNVPKSAVFAYSPTFKTLIVQFIKNKNEIITIELANDMYFTKEEASDFQGIEPNLERVLMELKPKFGVERVGRLKYQ
ncbi:MAG: hypothetical protein HRT58_21750 [Crocinitomicaceae bacterium]|nr:hypothetical protein [Flavobacteriales bacterium]NQZ38299.1 hypothetical protein [Crocinitomicaceae bacterium]